MTQRASGIDLHTHSTCSDGALAPEALVMRAADQGVRLLALTDHDTLDGLARAAEAAAARGMGFVNGVEFSCRWSQQTIHVLGLGVQADEAGLQAAVARMLAARIARGQVIDERLAKQGYAGVYAGAAALFERPDPARPHMAAYMVQQGWFKTEQAVFKRYLGRGKLGDVKAQWPELEEVVQWVRQAGGVAVLAHPCKYGLTMSKLKRLVDDFSAVGGEALEVWGANQSPTESAQLEGLCKARKLAASLGSDFHRPTSYGAELGQVGLPDSPLEKVWERWSRG